MRKKQPDPGIPFSGTGYAKDCIPLENKCNVTVVTEGREAGEHSWEMRARRQRSSTASERHEKKRQKVYKGRCGEGVLQKIGVNRRKTLRVDANQAETQ